MEKHLKLFLPFSLKELVLRKVAVLFCSNSDVLKLFNNKSLFDRLLVREINEWMEATEEKMLKLGLPESLNKQVIDRIPPMGFEIREWKMDNRCLWRGSRGEIEEPDLSKLCWTSTGAIDYRKTAEQYVLCDRLTVWQRFEIACLHCLEVPIPFLWHGHSVELKRSLEYCWPYILKGEQSKLEYLWREFDLTSFEQWAFEEYARRDNQVAVEYFFQKLTPGEREESLRRTACRKISGKVLFYLLSVMSSEQQMQVVQARPVEVLLCFLDWRRRPLLAENAGLVWPHLPQRDYGRLLIEMYSTLSRRNCFPKSFQEFLKHAPPDFIKESFLGHESEKSPPACRVLGGLVIEGDSESIELMFRHADAASRVKLVLCEEVFGSFYNAILKKKWGGVEACLREASLSEEDRGTLKESFRRFIDPRVRGTRERQKFRRFFDLLDETDNKEG